jgi:hypothetical protein
MPKRHRAGGFAGSERIDEEIGSGIRGRELLWERLALT